MTYLKNFSTNVTLSLLTEFTNFRFFIGETIQISLSNNRSVYYWITMIVFIHIFFKRKSKGVIRDVIPPDDEESSNSVSYGLDPMSYKYVVESTNEIKQKIYETISASKISRPKFLLTREKIRLFLRQHLAPKNGRYDSLSIKEESARLFSLDTLRWNDIFKGPPPKFDSDTISVKISIKQRNSEELNDPNNLEDIQNVTKTDRENKKIIKKKRSILSEQKKKSTKKEEKQLKEKLERKKKRLKKKEKLQKLKLKQKIKKKKDKNDKEGKENLKITKVELKNREKEAKKQFEDDMKIWIEKRDDLLCDDLKSLPEPYEIQCDIRDELIGDALVIIDFINVYQKYFSLPDNFPLPITFSYFFQILHDNNVTGTRGYGDLMVALMQTILNDENRDIAEVDLKVTENHENDSYNSLENGNDKDLEFHNNYSNHWMATYFCNKDQISLIRLNSLTLSEILRLYLLNTRNYGKSYKISPVESYFIKKLATDSVFDLDPNERVKLLVLILNDLIKVPKIREKIEDSMEEIFKLKSQIRQLNSTYTKWLRENPIRQRMRKKKIISNNTEANIEPEVEATQEEKEQYLKEKTTKERQLKENLSQLKAKIRKFSAFCRIQPLGRDRKYQKYWIFETIPGFFIEKTEESRHQKCFDSPLPMLKPVLSEYLQKIKRKKKKKNDPLLNQSETTLTNEKCSQENPKIERCTGSSETCEIHGSTLKNTTRWFFYTKEQLSSLIDSLNSRGFRESELRIALNIEKETIFSNYFDNFDPLMFNKNYIEPPQSQAEIEEKNGLRKSERIQMNDKMLKRRSKQEHLIELPDFIPIEAFHENFKKELSIFEENLFNSCFSKSILLCIDSLNQFCFLF